MAIWELADRRPSVHPDAWVHPAATVIGAVSIGAGSSVWPGAVLRGDFGEIVVGANTSVQDGAVVHCIRTRPTVIGDSVIVGHLAHVEGCRIGSGCLVGSGSVVLEGVVIEDDAAVAAKALVPSGLLVPSGYMAVGVPARIKPAPWIAQVVRPGSAEYVEMARNFRENARLVSP